MLILYPTSLANQVVEVGTRHSHQILLDPHETNLSSIWIEIQIVFLPVEFTCDERFAYFMNNLSEPIKRLEAHLTKT